jgi:hypothetical protein
MAKPRKLPIHEAARAVIAMELGVQVHYATSKSESELLGQVEHADATARQGAMIAIAGPMAATMTANIEYNLVWAREFDELWSFLRTLADERGILLDSDNPSEERIQLQELHDELASDVCMLLREHFACVDAVARELVAHRTLSGREIQNVVRWSSQRPSDERSQRSMAGPQHAP